MVDLVPDRAAEAVPEEMVPGEGMVLVVEVDLAAEAVPVVGVVLGAEVALVAAAVAASPASLFKVSEARLMARKARQIRLFLPG